MANPEHRREAWAIIGVVLTAILVGIAMLRIFGSDESGSLLNRPPTSPTAVDITPGPSPIAIDIEAAPSPVPSLSPTSEPEGLEVTVCRTPITIGQAGDEDDPQQPLPEVLRDDILQSRFSGVRPRAEPYGNAPALFWLAEGEQVEVVDDKVIEDEEGTTWVKVRRLGTDTTAGWVQLKYMFVVARQLC